MEEHIFERFVREHGFTVEEMRAIISARIESDWNDSDRRNRYNGERFRMPEKCRHQMSG